MTISHSLALCYIITAIEFFHSPYSPNFLVYKGAKYFTNIYNEQKKLINFPNGTIVALLHFSSLPDSYRRYQLLKSPIHSRKIINTAIVIYSRNLFTRITVSS